MSVNSFVESKKIVSTSILQLEDFAKITNRFKKVKKSNTPNYSQILNNKYYLNRTKKDIKNEKKRLKNFLFGPSILLAKNKEEYFKILSLRKSKIFDMKQIDEIESNFSVLENYYNQIEFFKKKFEKKKQSVIRHLLNFFYFEEYCLLDLEE